MKETQEPFQVSILPWAGLNEEIQIGPITFWPFHTKAEKNINEKCIKDQLERILKSYVDHEGHPVETITICSHGAHDFRELRQDEYDELVCAVDALIFTAICPTTKNAIGNNRSMVPPSADRYQLIRQKFTPGSDDISIPVGNTCHGGWKIGDITFPKPWHMGGAFASQDEELLKGFCKCFKDDLTPEFRNRIFLSLEWFRLAHTQSDVVSKSSKVVMMVTAFEIVLQVPKNGWKKRDIAEKLKERFFKKDLSIEEERKIEKELLPFPKISWWAWDFYDLRNDIVHGKKIDSQRLIFQLAGREWLTHLIIADLVYLEIIVDELFNNRLIGDAERDFNDKIASLYPDAKPKSYKHIMMDNMLDFSDIHKILGWEK